MKSETKSFDYIIIGAGSGGLLVAVGLLRLGKDVAVVSENIGGDCTHYGCVPSKTLLHLAKEYQKEPSTYIQNTLRAKAFVTVRDTIKSFATEEDDIIPQNRYFKGTAEFLSTNTLKVILSGVETILKFKKKCIIASGSSPVRMEIPGIPKERLITNEEFFYLKSLPKSISIIGGGPIGAELATACAGFGIETHLTSRSYLPKEPELISKKSLELLIKSAVKYHSAKPVKLENGKLKLDDGTEINETEYYLLALGRMPNTNIQLVKARVSYDKAGIKVDRNLITSNQAIFAIGDCTQNPQFTHLAANHGKFVVKKILVPFAKRRIRALPRVTFINPSIASVGTIAETNASHLFELNFNSLDRARTNFEQNSRGVISIDVRTGLVLGASLLGEFSEELINVITLMMDEQISVLRMSDFISPYPTYGNILHTISRDYMAYLSQNWKKYPIGSVKQFISYLTH